MQRTDDAGLAQRLEAAIRVIPDFPRTGIQYRDITPVLLDGRLFGDVVSAMADACAATGADIIAGVESRGFVLGGAIASTLGFGFVPVRKQGRLPWRTESISYALEYGEAVLEVHADALRAGQRVAVVDDLLATGGTAAAAVALIDRLGAAVAGLTFLVELKGLGGANALRDHRYTTLVTL